MIRPILFITVILYCILAGLFFGIVAGSIYSIIGLTLSSIIVYFFLHRTPKTFHHILSIKDKVLGRDTNFSKSQITWLRSEERRVGKECNARSREYGEDKQENKELEQENA